MIVLSLRLIFRIQTIQSILVWFMDFDLFSHWSNWSGRWLFKILKLFCPLDCHRLQDLGDVQKTLEKLLEKYTYLNSFNWCFNPINHKTRFWTSGINDFHTGAKRINQRLHQLIVLIVLEISVISSKLSKINQIFLVYS